MRRPLNLKWPGKKLESDREMAYSEQNIINLIVQLISFIRLVLNVNQLTIKPKDMQSLFNVMGKVYYLEDLVLVRLEGMQLQFQVS